MAEAVAAVHGAGTVAATVIGVSDLGKVPVDQLAVAEPPAPDLPTGRWLPGSVEVAGFRSLARASWVVARLARFRLRARLRRQPPGGRA
jgi:hypothetical protein